MQLLFVELFYMTHLLYFCSMSNIWYSHVFSFCNMHSYVTRLLNTESLMFQLCLERNKHINSAIKTHHSLIMPSCSQHGNCVLTVLLALLLPAIFPLLPPSQCKTIFSWSFRLICNSCCKFLSISSYSQKVWIKEWFALQEASCFPEFSGLLLFVEWGWYYTLQTKWLLTHPCPALASNHQVQSIFWFIDLPEI